MTKDIKVNICIGRLSSRLRPDYPQGNLPVWKMNRNFCLISNRYSSWTRRNFLFSLLLEASVYYLPSDNQKMWSWDIGWCGNYSQYGFLLENLTSSHSDYEDLMKTTEIFERLDRHTQERFEISTCIRIEVLV